MFGSLPICRVCLKTSLEYIDFDTPFEVDASIKAIDNDLTYLDCFQACTRIEIEFNENCPQSLCSACGLELKIAYEFIQKAESADKSLRELAANAKLEKFDDEESKFFLQPEAMVELKDNLPNENDDQSVSQLDDEKSFVCTTCGEQFFSQIVLNIHVNRSHTINFTEEQNLAVDKVECQICDMVVTLDNLNTHMQMHEDESNICEENDETINEETIEEEPIHEETIQEEVVVDEPEDVDFEMFDMANNSSEEEEVLNVNDSQEEDEEEITTSKNYESIDPDEEEILSQVEDEAATRDSDTEFNVISKIIKEQETRKSTKANYKQCDVCQKPVRESSFAQHMKIHDGVRPFPCDYCFQGYYSKRTLQKHLRAEHAEMLKSACRMCNETIDNSAMKDHIEEKHSHIIKCTECDYECQEVKMKDHMKRKHYESKDFLCNVCSKTFSSVGILNAHLKYHDRKGSRVKSDACHICGKVFSSNHYLKSHMLTHQEQRELFQCNYCDRTYHSKNALDNHMRIHTGDTIKCVLCKKEFARQYELNVHMRFHTKEYPFECELCNRKFAIKGHLRTHMWRHQGLKLQCEECGKLFTSTKALQEHSFYHSEMPFQCSYCPKAYPSKPKFKVHLKTAHMVEFSNEELQKMVKFIVPKRPRSKKFTLVQADNAFKEVEVHTKVEINDIDDIL